MIEVIFLNRHKGYRAFKIAHPKIKIPENSENLSNSLLLFQWMMSQYPMKKNKIPKSKTAKRSMLSNTIINHFNEKFKISDEEKELWKEFSSAEPDSNAKPYFDKIFNLYLSGLFDWILSFIKSKEIAAHIMQDSFFILWRKRKVKNTTDTQLRSFFRSVVIALTMKETKKMFIEWSSKKDKDKIDFWKWAEERKLENQNMKVSYVKTR